MKGALSPPVPTPTDDRPSPAPETTAFQSLAIKDETGALLGTKRLCAELYRNVKERKTAAALDSLAAEIEEAKTSTLFQEWLRVRRKCYAYRAQNTLLITIQQLGRFGSRDLVQSASNWKAMGRQVNPGAPSIWIWGRAAFGGKPTDAARPPSPSETAEPSDTPTSRAPTRPTPAGREQYRGPRKGARYGFVPVKVYDVRDTDGTPLPELKAPVEGDFDALFEALQAEASALGCAVDTESITNAAAGYSAHNQIRVDGAKGTRATRFGTLLHELAHEMLHQEGSALQQYANATLPDKERKVLEDRTGRRRSQREVEAEGTKAVLLMTMGLRDNGNAARYLAAWTHGAEEPTPSTLAKSLERIHAARSTIQHLVERATLRLPPAQRLNLPAALRPNALAAELEGGATLPRPGLDQAIALTERPGSTSAPALAPAPPRLRPAPSAGPLLAGGPR